MPEHETYAKLAEAYMRFVATSSAHHDMEHRESRTSFARGLVQGSTAQLVNFRRLRNYRFVLGQYAKPLQDVRNLKEMVQTVRDAIQGERKYWHEIINCQTHLII